MCIRPVYNGMKQRCYNTNNPNYHRYGGRGIAICDRWLDSYSTFESDMGPRPDGLTIERVDNNLGYSPDNCVWATYKEQANNRCDNLPLYTINGETKAALDWAEVYNISYTLAIHRLQLGIPLDKVVQPNTYYKFRRLPRHAKRHK